MPRQSLFSHPKFARLCHILREPEPHVLGYLEYLWNTAYQSGQAVIGDSVDIELASKYPGPPGTLTAALEQVRLIDRLDDGRYVVHDLADHAPDHVRKRWQRDQTRKNQYAPRQRKPAEIGGQCPPNSGNGRTNSPKVGSPEGEPPPFTGISPPNPELGGLNANWSAIEESRREENTPLIPPRGGGEGPLAAPVEEEAQERSRPSGRRRRASTPGDRLDLYPLANRVIAHYQRVVETTWPAKGHAASVVAARLAAGLTPEQLENSASGYAAHCRANDMPRDKRQAVHTYYDEDQGSYRAYLEYQAGSLALLVRPPVIDKRKAPPRNQPPAPRPQAPQTPEDRNAPT